MHHIPFLVMASLLSIGWAGGDKKWSYDKTGPKYWGLLKETFSACSEGRAQSPVNLTGAVNAQLPSLGFDYKPSPLEVEHKGHTIQVNIQPGSFLEIDDERFQLLQFHYHTLSEHTVDGQHFPMELHLVHANEAGELAVVGILMAIGKPNVLIDTLWHQLPGHPEITIKSPIFINPADLLPGERSYYRYDGSLTTPPCSEGVRWHVLTQPIGVSQAQVELFHTIIGPSARPVQPLNDRTIQVSGD